MQVRDEKILSKLQKLMALADSTKNPNRMEVMAATAKISQLMFDYEITQAEIEAFEGNSLKNNPYIKEDFDLGVNSVWRRKLMHIICENLWCRSITLRGKKSNMHRMVIVGQKQNIEVAEYLYTYLARELGRLATEDYKAYRERTGAFDRRDTKKRTGDYSDHGKAYKAAYYDAAITEIRARLDAQRRESEAAVSDDSRALVVLKDSEVQEQYNKFFPQRRDIATVKNVGHSDGHRAGTKAGREIPLNSAINTGGERKQITA